MSYFGYLEQQKKGENVKKYYIKDLEKERRLKNE